MHQVAGSDEDYYNNVTTEGEDAPDEEGTLGEEGLGHQLEDIDLRNIPISIRLNWRWSYRQRCNVRDRTFRKTLDCVWGGHTILAPLFLIISLVLLLHGFPGTVRHFREDDGLQFAIRQLLPSTLSPIHQIFKALPLILNLVKNEFGNVPERGEEGSVLVFRQPTSSSLKQSRQFTVGEWARGISPISVGFNPRVTNGAFSTLEESIKLLIVSKLVLTNPQRKFSYENSPLARIAVVFWLFCNGSHFTPHRVNNVLNAATTSQVWIDLGST